MNARRTRIYAFTVLVATLLLTALVVAQARTVNNPVGESMAAQERPPQNIYFTIKTAGNFTTLIKAIEAAGLVDTLKGSGPFTLFAPTDEAFSKLPAGAVEDLLKPENKEKLKAILAHHILPEKVLSAEMAGLREAKTVKRSKLKVDNNGGLKIDGASVLQQDLVTSNGVIHVIDTVLTPK
jgi:uncharacterized surface protein with fasciclin (FAS1) repeats